jgi:hypothetical protein
MKSTQPTSYKSALVILGGLILLIFVGVIWKHYKADLDLITYVSGVSTLAVALLTVAYVVTTNNQLSMMGRQLDEMRKAREYQAQPLPILREVEFHIEKPRFFYTPPEDSYNAYSRATGKFRVRNEGTHPAINIALTARLRIPSPNKKNTFGGASRLVEVIAEGGSYPPTEGKYESFLFTEDHNAELIATIREKDIKNPPLFRIRSVFRNTLGACYASTSLFMLYLKKAEDDVILKNWHASIVAFTAKYKTELDQLSKLKKRDEKEWGRIFEQVKEGFAAQLEGPEKLQLACVAVPMTFAVELLSKEQYDQEIAKLGFGSPIPPWFEGCVHKEGDDA